MSRIFDVLHRIATWWSEGLAAAVFVPIDDEAERDALDREREFIALMPWWL